MLRPSTVGETKPTVQHHPDRYYRYPTEWQARLRALSECSHPPLFDCSTGVISLGSCFADRIRLFLKDSGFRYVTTETNESGHSANWGRIYNPISMRQVVDYCEDASWRPRERWWKTADGEVVDPYRAVEPYASEEAAETDFAHHRLCARAAFAAADLAILTYGLAEFWESDDGAVFHSRPVAFDAARHRFRVLEFPECLEAVEATCQGIHRINPQTILVLTVSPVPLRATFRCDVDPISANSYGKSVLVAALQTASRRLSGTYYFPSYEIVREGLEAPFRSDGAISEQSVNTVISVFEKQFFRQDGHRPV